MIFLFLLLGSILISILGIETSIIIFFLIYHLLYIAFSRLVRYDKEYILESADNQLN